MTGYIYMIGAPHLDCIKIGYAIDPQRRLKELTCGSPYSLHVEAAFPAASRSTERRLRNLARIEGGARGEWVRRHFIHDELAEKAKTGMTAEEACSWLQDRAAIYRQRVAEFYDGQCAIGAALAVAEIAKLTQIIHEAEGLRAA